MRRALALALLVGCATAGGWRPHGPAASGWEALLDGEDDRARAAFAQGTDAAALFGAASLAYERGEVAAALDGYLALLELAPHDETARALAAAAAARLPVLLDESADRVPVEARILALPAALPWPARMALAELTGDIARHRADAALLESESRRSGCLAVSSTAVVGRLPHLDLEAPASAPYGDAGQVVARSGCRLVLVGDGRPSVRALVTSQTVAAGDYDLVLSFAGPAATRVDGGQWHHHGVPSAVTPRWSALRVSLAAGRHELEVRVGSWGGTSEATLLLVPAVDGSLVPGGVGRAVAELAEAVAADAAGDIERALVAAEALTARPHFAVGLVAAARVTAHDATRPTNIDRDGARLLFRKATAVDDHAARAWRDLAALERAEERPREASDAAEHAHRVAPGYWPAEIPLMEAAKTRGLDRDADLSLARALAAVDGKTPGQLGCMVLETALRQAQERRRPADEERLAARLAACDPHDEALVDRLRQRGDLAGALSLLQRRAPTAADATWVAGELAETELARGDARAAVEGYRSLIARAPRDPQLRIKLADAQIAAGDRKGAVATLTAALRALPARLEIRAAARALAIPLPLDGLRLDGREVVRAFKKAGRRYDAPAVLALDRLVEQVFPDGARMVLTHSIVRVQSKDGIERWGEVQIPDGAEVLTLRTHKPDGTIREPEEIFGKATISAPDLAPGDFVEWETLEVREPADAFAPGFLGDRFYFQSPEAPLDRSEYLLVTPPDLKLQLDARAGAPAPVVEAGPDGTRLLRMAVRHAPQLFPERSSVPAIEWVPSVRISAGVSPQLWQRFLADQLFGMDRGSPALRRTAQQLAATGDRAHLPEALARWVNEHVEPEGDLVEPATFALARGRGNRVAVLVALGRALGLPVDVAFARALTTAAPDAPFVPQELDDFGDVLVRVGTPSGPRWIDPRLRRAPFGYLTPALDGAPVLVPAEERASPLHARSAAPDNRRVRLDARLGPEGEASARVVEELSGWPALEWVEMLDRAGNETSKLRQDFEQRVLGQHFPGAVLTDLKFDVQEAAGTARVEYSFTHPELASRDGGVLKITPTFFRSQPARRYATEAARRTTLQVGPDIPLELEARFELPAGARVLELGESAAVSAALDQIRFAERRSVEGNQIVVRRQARLPILRVQPADYAAVAGALGRVDSLEAAEVRVALPPAAK